MLVKKGMGNRMSIFLTQITQSKWIYLVYIILALGIYFGLFKKEYRKEGEMTFVRTGKLGQWKVVPEVKK